MHDHKRTHVEGGVNCKCISHHMILDDLAVQEECVRQRKNEMRSRRPRAGCAITPMLSTFAHTDTAGEGGCTAGPRAPSLRSKNGQNAHDLLFGIRTIRLGIRWEYQRVMSWVPRAFQTNSRHIARHTPRCSLCCFLPAPLPKGAGRGQTCSTTEACSAAIAAAKAPSHLSLVAQRCLYVLLDAGARNGDARCPRRAPYQPAAPRRGRSCCWWTAASSGRPPPG